jgi:predicted metal-dependent phosphoesterase TrpH
VSLQREHLDRYSDRIDAVEVYNPKHLPRDNRRAREFAAEFDIPPFTSSYAHLRGTVGEAWTAFATTIDGATDLHAALRDGAERTVEHRDGPAHWARRSLEFAHLGWENSWQKLDRLYLSGTAPTHPTHVAYDGRFDDVRVY